MSIKKPFTVLMCVVGSLCLSCLNPIVPGLTGVAVSADGGNTSISANGATLQMIATINAVGVKDSGVTWSLSPVTGTGFISQDGLLSPVSDGTVLVTATSNDVPEISGSATITISNQRPQFLFAIAGTDILTYGIAPVAGAVVAAIAPPTPMSLTSWRMVTDPQSRFLFALAGNDDKIQAFRIDSSNGSLSEVTGSPFSSVSEIQHAQVSPDGERLYVVGNSIAAYTIDTGTGELSQIGTSILLNNNANATDLVIDPSGKFLYVSYELYPDELIGAYSINPTTGALTEIAGSPIVTGSADLLSLHVNSAGTRLYFVSNNISIDQAYINFYEIGSGGALQNRQGISIDSKTWYPQLLLAPGDKDAYLMTDGTIKHFKLDLTTGMPNLYESLNLGVDTYNDPVDLYSGTMDPDGGFLYFERLDDPDQYGEDGGIVVFKRDPVSGGITLLDDSYGHIGVNYGTYLSITQKQ